MATRYGTGSSKGRRQTDDTPLSDVPISKGLLTKLTGRGARKEAAAIARIKAGGEQRAAAYAASPEHKAMQAKINSPGNASPRISPTRVRPPMPKTADSPHFSYQPASMERKRGGVDVNAGKDRMHAAGYFGKGLKPTPTARALRDSFKGGPPPKEPKVYKKPTPTAQALRDSFGKGLVSRARKLADERLIERSRKLMADKPRTIPAHEVKGGWRDARLDAREADAAGKVGKADVLRAMYGPNKVRNRAVAGGSVVAAGALGAVAIHHKKKNSNIPDGAKKGSSLSKGLKLANARALSRVVAQQDAPIRGADHFEAFTGSAHGRAQLESLRRGAYANSKLKLRSGKAGGHKTTMSRTIDSGPLTRPETIRGLQSSKGDYRGTSGYKSSGVGKGLDVVRHLVNTPAGKARMAQLGGKKDLSMLRRIADTPAGRAHAAKIGPGAREISRQFGKAEVSKTRSYDPEHRRQQALGAATAALAAGGGYAALKGGKGIVATSKHARRATGVQSKAVGKPHEKADANRKLLHAVKSGVTGTKRDFALVGGGAAALGGAAGTQVHANSRRGKAWD